MARSLSVAALQALYSEESGEAFIMLLTLSHPTWPEVIRVSSDSVDTMSRGLKFTAFPFDIKLPNDDDRQPPAATLEIDNVSRDIVMGVRAIPPTSKPIQVKIEIVLASSPDTVEIAYTDFLLRDVQYDAYKVTGTLRWDDVLAEPFPGDQVTPATQPGVFY
jgi:hypothetical protein